VQRRIDDLHHRAAPRGCRFDFYEGLALRLRREVDFLAGRKRHVGLFPVAPAADEAAEALSLPFTFEIWTLSTSTLNMSSTAASLPAWSHRARL